MHLPRMLRVVYSINLTNTALTSRLCSAYSCVNRHYGSISPNPPIGSLDLSVDVYEPTKAEGKSPVLVLHGLLGSKTNWKSLAKIMAGRSGRRIYCLDARNHGDSPHSDEHDFFGMARDVERFLQVQDIHECVLIGHSMGGRTAMVAALQKPSLVEKLVVVDVSPINNHSSASSTILQVLTSMRRAETEVGFIGQLPEVRRAIEKRMAQDIQDVGLRQFVLTNLTEELVNGKAQIGWRVNLEVLEKYTSTHILKFPNTFEDKSYLRPTMFICGANSNYVRQEDFPAIKRYFPNSQIEFIEGAGHWVHAEKPTEFLNVLLPFL